MKVKILVTEMTKQVGEDLRKAGVVILFVNSKLGHIYGHADELVDLVKIPGVISAEEWRYDGP